MKINRNNYTEKIFYKLKKYKYKLWYKIYKFLSFLISTTTTTTTTTILYLTTLHLGAKKRSLKHVRAKTMYTTRC